MLSEISHKKGVGVDIEDIQRFRALPYQSNTTFYQNIFTQQEIDYCLSKADPCQHFAVRFCAKEAFIKASNKKISSLKKIEIIVPNKKPYVAYDGTTHPVSLAHEKEKAIAIIIIEEDSHETR